MRKALASAWQQDRNYPDFQSECWMVASGVAHQMDLLSPSAWKDSDFFISANLSNRVSWRNI
jgi:hypothetical protein